MANWSDALKTAKSFANSADSKTNGYFSNVALGAGGGALLGGAYGGLSDNGSVGGGLVGGALAGAGIGGAVRYVGSYKKVGTMTGPVSRATPEATKAPVNSFPTALGEASPSIKGMSVGNDASFDVPKQRINDSNYNASGAAANSRAKMDQMIAQKAKGNSIDYSPVSGGIQAPNWSLQDKAMPNSINYSPVAPSRPNTEQAAYQAAINSATYRAGLSTPSRSTSNLGSPNREALSRDLSNPTIRANHLRTQNQQLENSLR